ncbi:SDR family NAD(P)-dependent oxidoreductase [Denitrobaculum tricleocarpae]|uniref:Glucose 1-dehydrogenase n=1 Tax=Denitrobaculum tricleocarpae TaxID=2591009 RepID=A0A545STE2_9PROT|nr:glucose 1-dehydrogenase [Denitrobaculum tricleocarpae]TQV68221.1 glucose 1-dehydrogenase [Denitrobaculum tricleocarpae]
MTGLLKEKAGVVVGASLGIGRAAARLFAEEGARVAIVARRKDRLDELAQEIRDEGGQAVPIVADVTRAEDHARIVAETLDAFGAFDFAFNNAGTIGRFAPMLEQTPADWNHTIETNLTSVWMSLRAQAAQMSKTGGGAIVNTSSWLAVGALPGSTSYSASKAGMDGMLRAAALELAPLGIRINNINPGGIDTDMTRAAFNNDATRLEEFGKAHPTGRLGTARETAQLAAFLLSERAVNITGQAILIDGGYAIAGQRS